MEYIQELGHQVVAVADGETALDTRAVQRFDLLMVDVTLPGISGINLAKQLRAEDSNLPIILNTGHSETAVKRALGECALTVHVLSKPYDLNELAGALDHAVALARTGAV